MKEICYAGIGARSTPEPVIRVFCRLGEELAKMGFKLRSGAAKGADEAFERGADMAHGQKEIYLPWRGFNGHSSNLFNCSREAYGIAAKYHPCFSSLKPGVQKLQARNSYQVLGPNLDSPSAFVACYTENGMGGGGTGQAIRIARAYGVPVFDAGGYYEAGQGLDAYMDAVLGYAKKLVNGMETQAKGLADATKKQEIRVETPLGCLVAYPSTDPHNPGIYIDLMERGEPSGLPVALVEATEGETLATRVWGDLLGEDNTHVIIHHKCSLIPTGKPVGLRNNPE